MALKFLNKKGWHTGSIRNIETVWKAEEKRDQEKKKLEEFQKQILEERKRAEFRQLQEQAGLVPRQERLDFLYESGLGVGKVSSEGFKALEAPSTSAHPGVVAAEADGSSAKAAGPGALFEEKPQSANDAWRKLHTDPLLLIRQREQEALSRIKNNPIRMAMIRKSVEAEKNKQDEKKSKKEKKHKRKHKHSKSRNEKDTDSKPSSESDEDRRIRHHKKSDKERGKEKKHSNLSEEEEDKRKDDHRRDYSNHEKHSSRSRSDARYSKEGEEVGKGRSESRRRHRGSDGENEKEEKIKHHHNSDLRYSKESEPRRHDNEEEKKKNHPSSDRQGPAYKRSRGVPKMTEEEREARLREMQLDAELHEQQRWKRVKTAAEADAQEAARATTSGGKNFLDSAQKSIYGTEKGGSATIEESVRRRAYYSQAGARANETNAFRR